MGVDRRDTARIATTLAFAVVATVSPNGTDAAPGMSTIALTAFRIAELSRFRQPPRCESRLHDGQRRCATRWSRRGGSPKATAPTWLSCARPG